MYVYTKHLNLEDEKDYGALEKSKQFCDFGGIPSSNAW